MQSHQPKPHHGHRYPRTALWIAGGFALAALAWLALGVPTFVKYPTDLEASPRYEGTFRAFVDFSMAPLEEPMELPLSIDRRIEAVESESGSSRVLVRETIEQRAGDLIDTTQTNAYVMDRSTMQNVADDRAFAFEEANVVDRSGAYRLNLPFDTSADGGYEIYSNDIGGTYRMTGDEETPTSVIEGLELTNFVASLDEAPLSDDYLAELNKAVTLPETVTLDQLKPQLLAAGIDVDSLVAALTPVLSAEDAAALSEFAAEPIGLEYVMSFEGRASVEPVTGAEVKVGTDETVAARPVLTSLPALQEVLSHYPEVPAATQAAAALDDLATAPATPLFQFDYEQTPASVADIADHASSMRRQVLAAKVWLPLGLAAAAALTLGVGAVVALTRSGTSRIRPDSARHVRRHPRPLAGAGTTPPGSPA